MDGMCLSDAKILRCLSSGKVLKGLYLQKDIDESITPRNNLVEIPDNVQFFLPSIQEMAETYEFSNEELSETFVRVLKNEGMSLAGSFFSKILLVLARKQQAIKKLHVSKDQYFKKWLHRELFTTVCVPTASVNIENTERCKLSTPAIQKLQKLESCFKNGLNDHFLKQCDNFFNEFGSHYFVGTYHLGGRRKDSRIEKIKETNEKEGEEEDTKEHREEDKEHDKSPSINTTYEKYGGSLQDDDVGTWKRSLVEKPCNWFVIDKEESSAFNYRGVWTLLDPFKFKKQPKFGDALHEAWKKLTGLTIDPEIDGTDFLLESLVKVIEEKIDKDIFLMKCTDNVLIQTGRKTTVSDMITRVMNKDSNETLVPGEEEIEKTPSSKTMKKIDITVARLFDEYLNELRKTGNVMDSITSVLESEKLIPKKKVSDTSYNRSMSLLSSSTSSEEILIGSSSFEENADTDQKSNQDDSELATFYECHPNCKDCSKCQWCPVCCKVEST